ncbi:MAG: hypothetical protein RLW42_10415, partial [Gammaproteobacteria bacterium]
MLTARGDDADYNDTHAQAGARAMHESDRKTAPRADLSAPTTVHDLFERRFQQTVLTAAVDSLSDSERDALLDQIDTLARQLDSLIEASRKVRERLSFDVLLIRLMRLITEAF